MHVHPHLASTFAQARASELHRAAATARQGRLIARRPARSAAARRRLGRSLVRLGSRLAGDPTFTPARSR